MTEIIDWNEILFDAGDEPSHYQYVYLPNDSRLLLSKMVAGNRFLVPGRDSIYYGPSEQDELYRAALTAYNQLMNPIEISQIEPYDLALYSIFSEIMTLPNLAAFWPMSASYKNPADAGSGAVVSDVSGNGWNLSSVGYPTLGVDGGPYVSMNGFSQYLTTQNEPHLAMDGTELTTDDQGITICGMVKPVDTGSQMSVLGRFGVDSYQQCLFITIRPTGLMYFRIYDGSSNYDSVTAPISFGEWSFFCARYDTQDHIELLVDGVHNTTSTTIIPNAYEQAQFRIGKIEGGPTYFEGRIGMVWASQSYVSDERVNHLRDLYLALYGKEL